MNNDINIDETVWNFIDGNLNGEEISFVKKMIETDLVWRAKHAELLEVHELLGEGIQLEEPSLRFTKNVMEEISRLYIAPATKKYLNKNIIWGIGLFFLISIVGLVIYTFGQINWSQQSSLPIPKMAFEEKKLDFMYNNSYVNVFIMVNIVLGLVVLDMYLRGRKEEARG